MKTQHKLFPQINLPVLSGNTIQNNQEESTAFNHRADWAPPVQNRQQVSWIGKTQPVRKIVAARPGILEQIEETLQTRDDQANANLPQDGDESVAKVLQFAIDSWQHRGDCTGLIARRNTLSHVDVHTPAWSHRNPSSIEA